MTAIRKPTRRVATAIALAAGAAIALSACGSGQVSQTAVQQAAVNGNSADLGEIALRNVHIAYPSSEEYSIEPGGNAVLAFSIVNDSAETTDKLVSITTDYAARVVAGEEVGDLTIKPQTSLQAGQLPAGEGAATEAETQIKNNEENDAAPAAALCMPTGALARRWCSGVELLPLAVLVALPELPPRGVADGEGLVAAGSAVTTVRSLVLSNDARRAADFSPERSNELRRGTDLSFSSMEPLVAVGYNPERSVSLSKLRRLERSSALLSRSNDARRPFGEMLPS